jgi:predicted site-specific integrase-resolvase
MKFTLKQAADAVGKDRSTLLRAIKNGRMSASINDLGNYEVDAAELYRVFDAVARTNANAADNDTQPMQVDALQQQVQMQREFIATLEKLLDEANSEKRRLMQLLEHKPQKTDASELWKKVFKR